MRKIYPGSDGVGRRVIYEEGPLTTKQRHKILVGQCGERDEFTRRRSGEYFSKADGDNVVEGLEILRRASLNPF